MRGPILTLFLALAAPFAAGAASAPNGQISFWSDRANGRAQVFVMNADGTHQHRLTNLFSAKRGDFSPNGRKLVFDGRGYETLFDFDIFVMDADGSDVRRLTRGPERDTQASWSPDGRKILFSSDRGGFLQVHVMNVDGSCVKNISRSRSSDWATSWQRSG